MRTRQRHGQAGQAIVETALVLPVFLTILFMAVDVDRYFYARTQVEAAVHRAGRALTLDALRSDDCAVRTQAQNIAPGLALNLDSNSLPNDGPTPPPHVPSIPPNQALLYLFPAVATNPLNPALSCPTPPPRPAATPSVSAFVTYTWAPQTPLMSQLTVTILAGDTEPTQYTVP